MRVVIIGGGVSGLTAAAALAKDADVTVLEREDGWGYHASGRSAAMFFPDYGNDVVRHLNAYSHPILDSLGVLSRRGLLLVADASKEAGFHVDAEDMSAEILSIGAACQRVPILDPATVAHAGYVRDGWDIDTDAVLQHCRRAALSAGVELVSRAEVTGIERYAATWQIASSAGAFEADVIINAAGAWADEIAQSAGLDPLGLVPYRRSVARLPAPGGYDVRTWPMLLGAGESWYAKPDAGAWIVSPAEEDATEPHDAYASDLVLAEGLHRYEAHVTEPVTRVMSNWAGLRTFSADRTPLIGPDPSEPSFFWLAGQGGYGFQIAFAAAALARALILEEDGPFEAKVVEALSPARAGLNQTNSGR